MALWIMWIDRNSLCHRMCDIWHHYSSVGHINDENHGSVKKQTNQAFFINVKYSVTKHQQKKEGQRTIINHS